VLASRPGSPEVGGLLTPILSPVLRPCVRQELRMGWRFRKVVRVGPLRTWLSRSGIGYSWGFPGFRIGVAANGTRYLTLGIPGTGVYFIKYFPKTPSRAQPNSSFTQSAGSAHLPPPNQSSAARPPSSGPGSIPWWRQKNLP
jgi:hypothetical protein